MADLRRLRARVRAALADDTARSAVGRAARASTAKREVVGRATPDWEQMRVDAEAIRHDVVDHLGRYLGAFTTACEARGIHVHEAADAAAARECVVDIARTARARTAVKAKSILSEEVGISGALRGAGIETTETDLGAFIVQLRNESPSHLTAPAIHLTSRDIGHLFAHHLRVPYTDDAGTLTGIARERLRADFLRADVGLTGVNFGLANDGGIVVVENEGNALLSAAAPRVHIALMGIERLLPDASSLPLFLRLLCGSATGQPITSYVRWIRGPRTGGDAPTEMHVVLIDNGRRALRANPEARELLHCIRCGACQNVCPIYRRIGGAGYGSLYGGPIGATISSTLGPNPDDHTALPFASTLCGACHDVCPVRIDLPRQLLRLRRDANAAQPPRLKRWGMRAFAAAAERPGWFRTLASLAAHAMGDSPWGRDRAPPRSVPGGFAGLWARETSRANPSPPSPDPTEPPATLGDESRSPRRSQPEDTFANEAKKLALEVIHAPDTRAAADALAATLDPGLVVIPRGRRLAAIARRLQTAGLEVTRDLGRERLAAATTAVTETLFGVADTATIALGRDALPDPVVAALPRTHVALLDREKLHPDLSAAFAAEPVREQDDLLLITGPSRTADIEKRLVLGAHGPQRLIVVLLG